MWPRFPNAARGPLAAIALLFLALSVPGHVLAHASLEERIAVLDGQIAAAPTDVALYLERGRLHRLHEDWPAALADYQRAAELDPDNHDIEFFLGITWLDVGRPTEARLALDRVLDVEPEHADALLTRGRASARLGETGAAIEDYSRAIDLIESPGPQLFLERARLQLADDASGPDEALAGLDEALERLGPVITLVQFAVEIERDRGRPDAALVRLEILPERLLRLPKWRATRGDLLVQAGREKAAREAFQAALAAIEDLPPARRNSRANLALEARLKEAIADLQSER